MKRKIIIVLLSFWLGGHFLLAIQVRLPNLTGVVGDTITVPLYVDDNLTGKNITAFQFDIGFNSSIFKILEVNKIGTISSVFNELVLNSYTSNFRIVCAGNQALSGSGILINIKIQLIKNGASTLSFLNTTAGNFFNEGTPALTFSNGYISIAAKPTINVYPTNSILNINEVQQFSAYGGTAPYTWSVSDANVVTIAADGKLTVLKSGKIKVAATDSKKYRGETEIIDCRSFYITIRDTSFYQNNLIEIPVLFNNLDRTPVYAGKFQLSFYEDVISFDSLITRNSILSGNFKFEYIKKAGKAIVTFAGSNSNTESGILFVLRFKIANIARGNSWINFDETLINETLLMKSKQGQFSIQAFPDLQITPAGTVELFTGDTKQFNVSGGTAPYSWSVENGSLAAITNSGFLTTLSGGSTKVMVKDIYGANSSKTIDIYDTWVDLRDSIADLDNSLILTLPIDLGPIPVGKEFSSLSGNITYNSTKIDSIRITNSETLTAEWLLANKIGNNESLFALSGVKKINIKGELLNLKIHFKNTVNIGDNFTINCNNLLLNEGSPNVKSSPSSIKIKNIFTDLKTLNSNLGVRVFPIPAFEILEVELAPEFYSSEIILYDLVGKVHKNIIIKNKNAGQLTIPIGSMINGIYFLKVNGFDKTAVVKFIKQ